MLRIAHIWFILALLGQCALAQDFAHLWKRYEVVTGQALEARDQGNQNDCVAHSFSTACDILTASQIMGGSGQAWPGRVCVEILYAGARELDGDLGRPGLDLEDGANWLKTYGALHYLPGVDYTQQRSRQYRNRGVSANYKANGTPIDWRYVDTVPKVKSALKQGHPVIIGSFYQPRPRSLDADGFTNLVLCQCEVCLQGRQAHAMTLIGFDDRKRPGVVVLSSEGPGAYPGPRRHSHPRGSFWVSWADYRKAANDYRPIAISSYGWRARPKTKLVPKAPVGYTVVAFTTSNCPPCRAQYPIWSQAKARGAKVVVVNDRNKARQFGIREFPTTVVMQGNRVVFSQSGHVTLNTILRISRANPNMLYGAKQRYTPIRGATK